MLIMKNKGFLTIPLAIILAGFMIAVAVIYATGKNSVSGVPSQAPTQDAKSIDNVSPVNAQDHILGSLNAPVKVIEFADTECPFCKLFHSTMHQIMSVYGQKGQVAWVYRQFPLNSLHPKAPKEAEATECVNELGGNSAFWAYLDKIFAVTPSNNGLDPAELPQLAQELGIDVSSFNNCLNSGKYSSLVQSEFNEAVKSGGDGTPYTIVVAANGKKFLIPGAEPYSQVSQIIESALAEK